MGLGGGGSWGQRADQRRSCRDCISFFCVASRRFHRRCPSARQLGIAALALVLLVLEGCVPLGQRSSGRVFPLSRQRSGDGLAVVTRPGGEGLHIWLDTDTETEGICRPRWNPDAARLVGGDGPSPHSGGRAPRQEFYGALGRGRVRWALRRQMAQLCQDKAPRSRFVWVPPPRHDTEHHDPLPQLTKWDLLSSPRAVNRAEKQLLGQPLSPEDLKDALPEEEPPGP